MDSEAFEAAEEPPVCCGGIESVLKKKMIHNFFLGHLLSSYWRFCIAIWTKKGP